MNSALSLSLGSVVWPAFFVDETGIILFANPPAHEAFGKAIDVDGCPFTEVLGPENDLSGGELRRLTEPGAGELHELRFKMKDGVSRAFIANFSPCTLEGIKGFCVQLFSVLTTSHPPVPVLPGVDHALVQKQKLECALQLARTVALDFNNALTSILGHASLLLAKSDAQHPWRSSLVEIEKSAARAAEIANDLAAFSRHEKDTKVQLAGNLNVLIQRTVDLFRTREDQGTNWDVQLEKRLFTVKFDEAKLQQALVKIIENAVQSLGERRRMMVSSRNVMATDGPPDPDINLPPGNYVVVEVTDTGSGIPSEVMPRVFEPFFTTKDPAKHRGLGLAWVYGVITNHGGAVHIKSQPDSGTTVRVFLPANKKIVKADALPDSALYGQETILIVDDEDLLLTMGQMVLSSYGYHVLTANSGLKALDLFQQTSWGIDLLVTDLVMPNMSGRELVEKVRTLSPSTRILCTSGFVRPSREEESDSYLQKPFTSQELLRKVRHILQD